MRERYKIFPLYIMRKRTAKERFMPLVGNLGLTALAFGGSSVLMNKADKASKEKKSFKAGVYGGLGTTLATLGSICATFGTMITGANALCKNEYTDEELDESLD